MKCPNCDAELAPAKRHGVEVEYCNACKGMWLNAQELDELEDEAFDLGKKGTLVFDPAPNSRKCPECSGALNSFQYRDYDLQLEFCPSDHGYWLNAGQDDRVLQLMRQEEHALERKFGAEDNWTSHLKHWRSPSFIDRLRGLFQ